MYYELFCPWKNSLTYGKRPIFLRPACTIDSMACTHCVHTITMIVVYAVVDARQSSKLSRIELSNLTVSGRICQGATSGLPRDRVEEDLRGPADGQRLDRIITGPRGPENEVKLRPEVEAEKILVPEEIRQDVNLLPPVLKMTFATIATGTNNRNNESKRLSYYL